MNIGYTYLTTYFIKLLFLCICSYYTLYKITNLEYKFSYRDIVMFIYIIFISILCTLLKKVFDSFISIFLLVFSTSFVFSFIFKYKIGYSLITNTFSFSINYAIFYASIIIYFFITLIFPELNDYVALLILIFFHLIILAFVLKIKRIKNGLPFFNLFLNNEYFDILILDISIVILFLFNALTYYDYEFISSFYLAISIIISIIMMVFTVQGLLTLYYKHNLLVKDLNDTKSELEKKNEEIMKLEQENLELNKKNHSIAHKQRALEYKINEIVGNSEFSSELSIINDAREISNEFNSSPVELALPKTDVENIDDMLTFMQSECIKNNIIFELQLTGDIHHMINKYIAKEKLEILLADHIKNAIIAIDSSDNINKSILVKLGIFDGIYSIYFYDSGIPFEEKTLDLLGKNPITTHKDSGGTGFGFMNTFDTLKECNASIEIKHIGKPSKDNYTKCIIIRFDNKNEIKLK